MWKWLTDRWETLLAALGEKWRTIPKWTVAIAGTPVLTWVTGYLDRFGLQLTELPVWPWWARMVASFLGVCFLIMLDYGTKRRLELIPRVKIGLAPIENLILKHPVERGGSVESMKRVVKGKVLGLTQSKVQCTAHLTAVRFQAATGEPFIAVPEFASLSLPWTRHDEDSDSVPKGVTKHFRIVQAQQDDNRLYVPRPQEITLLRRLFSEPGNYELDIVVTAGENSTAMTVSVAWTGNWADLTAVEKPAR